MTPPETDAAPGGTLRLHATIPASDVNGPGRRFVVWLQGCTLGCRGCFNPATHDPAGGETWPVDDLATEILARARGLAGVTISGGEPLQQAGPLRRLVRRIRNRSNLSIVLFSGYRLEEIERIPARAAVLPWIDVLIAGRYVPARHRGAALLGSANQRIHLLSDRHRLEEFAMIPPGEIRIGTDGTVEITGVDVPNLGAPGGAFRPGL